MAGTMAVKALKPPSTKAADHRWHPGELRMLLAQLRAHLAGGANDVTAQELMSLSTSDYNALKCEMYEQEKVEIHGKSVEQVFIDYTIKQESCIRDLDIILKNAKSSYNSIIGAARAKSDIIDKIIDRGQEFGLIEKVPEKKLVVAGIMVSQLDNKALRTVIMKQVHEVGSLMKKYGEAGMLDEDKHAPSPALPVSEHSGDAGSTEVPESKPEDIPTPSFSDLGKTGKATGGIMKAKGGKAVVIRRIKVAASF